MVKCLVLISLRVYTDKEAINNLFVFLLPNHLLGWMTDAGGKKKKKKLGGECVVTVRNKNDKSGNILQQSFILHLENISFELLSTSLFIVSNFESE